jgi:hypothetical protein
MLDGVDQRSSFRQLCTRNGQECPSRHSLPIANRVPIPRGSSRGQFLRQSPCEQLRFEENPAVEAMLRKMGGRSKLVRQGAPVQNNL